MKKSTKNILTVAAVLVGGYFLLKALHPVGIFPATYLPPTYQYQKADRYRVF